MKRVRIYAEYYSKLHQLTLTGRIIGKKGNRVVLRIIDRNIDPMLVHPSLIKRFVAVDDNGPVEITGLEDSGIIIEVPAPPRRQSMKSYMNTQLNTKAAQALNPFK